MKQLILIIVILIVASVTARARAAEGSAAPTIAFQIAQEISHKYPMARVELVGDMVSVRGEIPESAERVSLLTENGRGEATLLAVNGGHTTEIRVPFKAWASVRVANRRIMPGEALNESAFNKQDVNLSEGQPFVYRGVILPGSESIAKLETRQSILEGQFLVQNAVQRTPDVKRGDWVKIELSAGDLKLSTTGSAAEPGFTSSSLKVITAKTKRELAGKLRGDGVVEVNL